LSAFTTQENENKWTLDILSGSLMGEGLLPAVKLLSNSAKERQQYSRLLQATEAKVSYGDEFHFDPSK